MGSYSAPSVGERVTARPWGKRRDEAAFSGTVERSEELAGGSVWSSDWIVIVRRDGGEPFRFLQRLPHSGFVSNAWEPKAKSLRAIKNTWSLEALPHA